MVCLMLRPYQTDAVNFLRGHDRALVLAKVGAGKTLIALSAMQARPDVRRWLIFAPKRVCEEVWEQERAKWNIPLSMVIATGTPAARAKAFAANARVTVTNYDNIQSMPDLSAYDGVIFDELTRLKDPGGKRFKVLDKAIAHVQVRWGLTGSFTSNGLEDVFGQCKIVDSSLLGRTKNAFFQQYFFCVNREWGQYEPRRGALAEVMERIKPATYVLENADYADKLPPLHTVQLPCTLAARKPYDDMRKTYVAQFASGAEVSALSAGAASQKLCQMASGFVYSAGDAVWYSPHKFDRLDELLNENQQENTIVVYNYKEELAELQRRYSYLKEIYDHGVVSDWNAGKVKLLALHPMSAGHGLNLQYGGCTLVFLSLPWSLEMYEQTIGRLHRGGQTRPVWVYAMITGKTIDERIWSALQDKRSVSDAAIDELR
jgi:SNF2 family DNA or RNA helicase